jgi:hypothetical protein
MQKYYQVSDNERQFIKNGIEEKFNLKIISTNDCKLLAEIIFDKVHILISYNTLRRFFNILSSTNSPSSFTVNLLSTLLGFPDFISLREHRINANRDFIHENLHLLHLHEGINTNILNEIIPLLHENHWENIYQIRSLIDLFIKKGQYELITLFFDKNIDENNHEELYKYYVAFQPIHAAATLNNKPLINFISKSINKYKVVQQVLLQLYVEESKLEDYYGAWINNCSEYFTSDVHIFCTCIKVQFHFSKKEKDTAKILLNQLNAQVRQYSSKIHPIMLGRIAAWNFIIKNDSSYLERYIVKNSDVFDNISTLTFFYKLLYLYGNKKQFIKFDYITLLQTENLRNSNKPFNIKTELTLFYLILSRYYLETKKIDLALNTFGKIDKRYQFSCSSDFFMKEYELLSSTLEN